MRFLYVLLCLPISALANNLNLDININAYAEPVSIKAFTDDWHDTLKKGDKAFLQGRAEISTKNQYRQLSILWRYDYLLDFSEQTAQIYHAYKNNYLPIAQQDYPLFIKAKYSESYGIRWLQYQEFNKNLKLGLAINLLKGYKITDGQLEGNVNFKQQGFKVKDINNMQMDVNYYYDEPQLKEEQLEWYPKNPSALGFSVDAELAWQINPKTHFLVQINDIYGRLYWQDIPTTQYNASCQCYKFTHNIEGQLAIDDKYTQKLLINGKSILAYQLGDLYKTELRGLFNQSLSLWQGVFLYNLKNNWQSGFITEPQTRSLGVELKTKNIYVHFLTDDLNTNQAHRLGFGLGVYQQW
ncbi:MAG TPA: hypothetical protein PLF28_08600 [Agitococcus sp.]|nr:hypothetical protein [Agitococcus sp.]